MNIVLVTEYFPQSLDAPLTGGVETRSHYIAQALSKTNIVTVICSYQRGLPREHYVGDVRVLRVGPHHAYSSTGSILTRLLFANAVVNIAGKLKDIHVVDGYNFISYLPAHRLAKKLNAKCVATYHEVWIGEWIKNKGLITGTLGTVWERIVLRKKWDGIICVSEFTADKIRSRIKSPVPVVIPNGVKLVSYVGSQTKYPVPTIVSIGRLTPQKQHKTIIDALPRIKQSIPDIHYRIVGTGPELEALQLRVKKLRLTRHVTFMGFMSRHDDVIRTVKKSHLLVSGSTLEGFGIALLESMACGVPYVATAIPSFIEITDNGRGGALVPTNDAGQMATQIVDLLNDKRKYDHAVKEGRTLVTAYDWDAIAKHVEKYYQELL